jgi:hypothetical protein
MSLSRRDLLKIGLGAGATPALGAIALTEPRPARAPAPLPAQTLQARPLPLSAVRLAGGPIRHAQDLDARYLLELEPDRMLAYYRQRAGLTPKAEPYGGWDGGGRNLTGHVAGHYLSAVSLMWEATGDERFKARADHIVNELKQVQDKHGDGYLSALEGGRDGRSAPWPAGRSGRAPSTSMASGRRGTRCPRPTPGCATRIGSRATAPRSRSR